MYAKALMALNQVELLDGTPVRTYATRAQIHAERMEFIEAAEMFRLAVTYTPSDGYARQLYSTFLSSVGYLERSLKEAQAAVDLDPTSPVNMHRLAIAYVWMDMNDEAARYFALAQSVGVGAFVNPEPYLLLLLRQGRYEESVAWLETVQNTQRRSSAWVPTVVHAVIERDDKNLGPAISALDDAKQRNEISPRLYWGFMVLLEQTDRAIGATHQLVKSGAATDELQFLFGSECSIVRASPEFAGVVEQLGLDDFWDVNGWPRVCSRENAEIRCR
jgi:tetratricopeptide (TPR) repeat protein